MKVQQCIPLVLIFILLTASVTPAPAINIQSLPTDTGFSSCGVEHGFTAGTMLGATIAALTPGGQAAAVILGLTALSFAVATSILC